MTINRCTALTALGSRCELPASHDGRHSIRLPSGDTWEWTDDDTRREINRLSSRFD